MSSTARTDGNLINPNTNREVSINNSNSFSKSSNSESSHSFNEKKRNHILCLKDEEEEPIEMSEKELEVKFQKLQEIYGLKTTTVGIVKLISSLSDKYDYLLMILGSLGSLGAGVSAPLFALLLGRSLVSYSTDQNLNLNSFEDTIGNVFKMYFIVGVGVFFSYFLMYTCWSYVGSRQTERMKGLYFRNLMSQEQSFYDFNNAYEFSTKVQGQIRQIENGIGDKLGIILMMISQIFSGLIIGFSISWSLTLLTLTVSPFMIICGVIMGKAMNNGLNESRKAYEKAGGIAEEILMNIRTVASFVNFEYEKNRFDKQINACQELGIKNGLNQSLGLAGIHFFSLISFSFSIIVGSHFIVNKNWNSNAGRPFMSGDVISVIITVMKAVGSIRALAPNYKYIAEASTAASDFFALFERKPVVTVSDSNLKPDKLKMKGEITFKNVEFTYPLDPSRKILKGVNLTFEAGKKIAIVGESGSGKSTIINLIERFYEPDCGEILIDGIGIKDIEISHLRSLIGYVQQEPVLFNNSIKENILFGRANEINNEDGIDLLLQKACDNSCSIEFINKLSGKLDYNVGIKGSNISGGQRQRIAIARAILKSPKIILLDEATAALDNLSEKWVQRALDKINENTKVTTIIVAHRLSTIQNADKIYVLRFGKVVEEGNHLSLIAQNGFYAQMVKSQIESSVDNVGNLLKENIAEDTSRRRSSFAAYEGLVLEMNNQPIDEENLEDDELIELETPREIDRLKIFHFLKENKLDMLLASIGSSINGGFFQYTVSP